MKIWTFNLCFPEVPSLLYKRQVSMTRPCHNHRSQTGDQHTEMNRQFNCKEGYLKNYNFGLKTVRIQFLNRFFPFFAFRSKHLTEQSKV